MTRRHQTPDGRPAPSAQTSHRAVSETAVAPMPELDTEVPVLLLRLDRNPFHHGTLGAVRSLGRAGVEVHSLAESRRSPIGCSRYLHRAHRRSAGVPESAGVPGTAGVPGVGETEGASLSVQGADEAALAAMLRRVAERIGRPAVLIPMDDLSAIATARLADRLDGRFLLPAQPPDLPQQVADKAELAAVCRRLGVPHPRTVLPGSAEQAADVARELGLPVVAKWSRPWLLPPGSGLRSTAVLHTPGQARRLYERSGQAGSRLLLQRRLPGGAGTDWFFHGCFTAAGGCLLGGAGRKERAWPPGTGLTAVGRWLPNPEVERWAARLARRLGFRGILDLDFRLDPATGSYHLLDFNPRPGAQFRLFTDRAGLDMVRVLHLDLTGRTVPAPVPVPGRVFRAENYTLLSCLATAGRAGRRGAAPVGAVCPPGVVARSAAFETAWFAADDPLPALAMALAGCGRGGRKGLHRLRARGAGSRGADRAPTGGPPERRSDAASVGPR